MANSATDARGTEMEIRKRMIQEGTVDAIVAVGANFFYTVTLPCTLWFLDRGKKKTDAKTRFFSSTPATCSAKLTAHTAILQKSKSNFSPISRDSIAASRGDRSRQRGDAQR